MAEDGLESEKVEGFGVGEKAMVVRDLVESVSDFDISVAAEDLIEPKEAVIEEEISRVQSTEKTVPTLHPMTVLRFVAPTLALWIAPPVMSLIDTSVVGRYCGPTDLAALSPGCTLIDSSAYLFMFIATAATNLVASSRADGDEEGAQRTVSEAIFLAFCCGTFLMSIVLTAGRPLLSVIAGQESAEVVPSALRYATVRAFGQQAVIMASVARAAALARKDTRGPLVSVALAFGLNVVGTLALVRGAHLGIVGAAIGTLVADCAATTFLLARMRRLQRADVDASTETSASKQLHPPKPLVTIPTSASLRRFLRYAAPIFFTILGKSVVYNGVGLSIGRLGATALAAHQVLLRSFFFWTPVGDSVGMTSQVFLPGILAEERRTGVERKGAKRLLFTVGVLAGLCAATLAGLLPSRGAGLFTTDVHVAAALAQTAPILAVSVALHAIALTCEGMLLAQRDLAFLSSSYVLTTIATAALLLSSYRPDTLGGSWWILALFQGGRAAQFALRTLWIARHKRRRKKE
jgi:putative MATE family efflux protein